MNLKPNLWTLLFLLVAIAMGYQYFQAQPVSPFPPKLDWESEEYPLYSIPIKPDTAIKWMNDYRDSIALPSKELQLRGELSPIINNLDIRHFKIEHNVMAMMMRINKGQNVYAIPVLQTKGRDSLMIDIVFSNVNPDSSHFSTTAMIFDFSSPCPTLCNQ